jgi:hypothetical protein
MLVWFLISFLLYFASVTVFFQFRSTPTHLVIGRRHRPGPKDACWFDVQRMELENFGLMYHRLDGTYVPEGFTREEEQARRDRLDRMDRIMIEQTGLTTAQLRDMPVRQYAELRREVFDHARPVRTPLSPYDPEHDRLVANTKAGRAAHDDGPVVRASNGGKMIQVTIAGRDITIIRR